ncbi:hypothetical protein SLS62_000040 [Diatrype stigma]|uniref:Uncharacterized protein n=1 Tax=Diatrype stigma TaxID=117547 RepID=A0AAN9V088_9PEZI
MPTLVRNFRFSQATQWGDDDTPPSERDTPIRAPVVTVTADLCTSCQLDKTTYGKFGAPYQDGIFEAVSAIAVAAAEALDEPTTPCLLTQAFIEDVFAGLVRHGLFASDPAWRDDDPLTFHVDPVSDPTGWDAVRAEFARAVWLLLLHGGWGQSGGADARPSVVSISVSGIVARLEQDFGKGGHGDSGCRRGGGGIAADALQLVAREALDEYVLLGRLGEVRNPSPSWDLDGGFRNVEALRHPVLRRSIKDLRAARKEIVTVEQFFSFLGCLDGRLKAQGTPGW